jgi:uncharacterized membrane protein (DUF4010 family)
MALAVPLLAAALFQAAAAYVLIGRGGGQGAPGKPEGLVHRNPFLIPEVLRYAVLLAAVMLAASIGQTAFGANGLMAVAALSGLADVDAMTLSVAKMSVETRTAVAAILLTVAVNTLAKSVYAGFAGNVRLGIWLFVLNAAAMVLAAGSLLLLLPLLS